VWGFWHQDAIVDKPIVVKVEVYRSNFRLRWTYPPTVKNVISLGLEANAINLTQARMRAAAIEGDILRGNFDLTLDRYRQTSSRSNLSISAGTILELMDRFIEHKSLDIKKGALTKYVATRTRLSQYFVKPVRADQIGLEHAAKFRDWLMTVKTNTGAPLANITVKERLGCVASCWDWGIEQKLLTDNPWKKASRQIKKERSLPKPLTIDEIQRTVDAFRHHPEYSFYADLVTFLLGCGARFGEVSALRWTDVNSDCSQCYFGKSYSRGEIGTTKNQKAGWVSMPSTLQKMLLRRRTLRATEAALIFPSRRSGDHINDRVFRKVWGIVLKSASIPYRKPYSTRATLISHWLSRGEDPATVAEMTRTSIKMIMEHYAGSIKRNVILPDLFTNDE
jgi:integrase